MIARAAGIEGFERHVVIKRIRAEQARDATYVEMFLDEARLAASLHHANIVQVNDIGQVDGEYFFAMEYVLGEDVRKILGRAAETGSRVPLEHILTIVCGAAAGLHHAHEQIRADGSELGIVHRDVSPANILVGLDGGVKLSDFGIAKANSQRQETQSGVLKGKVAYMSPEQCNNEPVDRRSDVYSLGIVLYELLTIRPLFPRDNDFLTMSAIVHQNVAPPSTHAPEIPAALDAIVCKALARRPEDRYATADELRRALERFADDRGVRMSTTALADYMKAMFGQRREPWLVRPGSEDEATESLSIEVSDAPSIRVEASAAERAASVPIEPPRRSRRWIAAIAAGGLAVIATAIVIIAGARRADATTEPVVVTPRPARAEPVMKVENVEPAPPPAALPADPVPVAPAKTVRKKPVPKRSAPKAAPKRWDPNALFPD
jgi:serine/threonine-protein kinase